MNSTYKQLWSDFDGSSLSFLCFRKSTPQENPSIDDGTFMVPEEIENPLSYSYKCRKEKVRCKPSTTSRTLVNNHAYFSTFAYYCAPSSSWRFLAECSEPVLCPETGTVMEKCGTAKRVVKEPGIKWYIWVPVYFSKATGRFYRVLPDFLLPYKHYTANTIKAAQENHLYYNCMQNPSHNSNQFIIHTALMNQPNL